MNDLFFIKYKPKVMLVDTLDMPADVELAHRRLCDFIWAMDGPPDDNPDVLRSLCRAESADWVRIRGGLLRKGWKVEQGKFVHGGAMASLQEGHEYYKARCERTRAATEARNKQRNEERNDARNGQRGDERSVNESQSQSQSQSQSEAQLATAIANRAGAQWLDLMSQVKELLGEEEWHTRHKRWHQRATSNPTKLQRVLAEVAVIVKEGRITKSPAACAEDVWKRF